MTTRVRHRFSASEQQILHELQNFVWLVAAYSRDPYLAHMAQDLLTLYGDPTAEKPRGLINV